MPTTRDVWDYLAIERDEAAVLTAVYRSGKLIPTLAAASLLIGPPDIASQGWPGWRLNEGFKPVPRADLVALPATFVVEQDELIVGRATLSQAEAYQWLKSVLEDGLCPAASPLPESRAELAPARSPIRVCTHSQMAAGDLATWLGRPITGFHFSGSANDDLKPPDNHWTVDGADVIATAVDLLGMSWFDAKRGPAPAGLLLGRFERTAWLLSQRLDIEHDLYNVQIGIEKDRVDLADLEIEVEERVDEELVFAEHLRLEDTDIREAVRVLYGPPPASGKLEIGIGLPNARPRCEASCPSLPSRRPTPR